MIPEEVMTAEQALALLNEVSDKYLGTRTDHENLKTALRVLAKLSEQSKEAKDKAIPKK